MTNVTINYRTYLALLPLSSTKETRFYLNGIHVEPNPTGPGIIAVATDGHRLGAILDESGSCDGPAIISNQKAITKLPKPTRESPDWTMNVTDSMIRVTDGKQSAVLEGNFIVDGSFPDWRRGWPTSDDMSETFGVNAAYVGDFAKVAKALDVPPTIAVNRTSNNGAMVIGLSCFPNFRGLLMPLRVTDTTSQPLWWAEHQLDVAAE